MGNWIPILFIVTIDGSDNMAILPFLFEGEYFKFLWL